MTDSRVFDVRRTIALGLTLGLVMTVAAASSIARPTHVLAADPTPVARWTFDEGAGSIAADSVGELDGTLAGGASWITSGTAQGGGAISFDGVDDVVTVNSSPVLEPAGSFTVSFWVRSRAGSSPATRAIVQKNFYGCDVGSSWSADQGLEVAYARLLQTGFLYSTGPSTASGIPVWDGEWHRYAMVIDAATGIVGAWIDGNKATGSFGGPLEIEYGSTGRLDDDLRIGGPGADCLYSKPFQGEIDDLRIYATALTDDQVRDEIAVASPPTVSAPTQRFVAGTGISGGRIPLRVSWVGHTGSDPIASYALEQSVDGGLWTSVATDLPGPSVDRLVTPGHTYRYRLTAYDVEGRTSSPSAGATISVAQFSENNRRVSFSGSWTTVKSSAYWGGAAKSSSQRGAKASITFTGRSIAWVARKGPTRGKAEVYVNGTKVATVDLRSASFQDQRVAWAGSWTTRASRKVTIRVLGTSGRPRVDFDAFVTTN